MISSLIPNPLPNIKRVIGRIDDPDYHYERVKGHIIAIDSEDVIQTRGNIHSSGSLSSRSTFTTLQRAIRIETENGQMLVLFNRKTDLPLNIGDEIWVIGYRETDERFKAYGVMVPSMQSYADLIKLSVGQIARYILFSLLIAIIGYSLMITAPYTETEGLWGTVKEFVGPQYGIGIGLIIIGFLLLTTGLSLVACIGTSSTISSKRANTSEWTLIERSFR